MNAGGRLMLLLLALAGAGGLYLWTRSRAPGADGQGDGGEESGDGAASPFDSALNFIETQAGRVTAALVSRGYRNNNPGNLRTVVSNPWQGQIGDDGGYGVYDTPENGTRALGHQLRAYAARGLDTATQIISTWAPASDNNNTAAYIADISTSLSIGTDEPIDVEDRLADLAEAIARHENGYVDSGYDWTWVYLA